jgi:predicted DNA-binding transcriptional regulator AlpA
MRQRRARGANGRDGATTAEQEDAGAIVLSEPHNVFSECQAAKYCGICAGTLRLWRSTGTGPAYFRAGAKLIRYRRSDLDEWIEGRITRPSA